MAIATVNPATGETVRVFAALSPDELDDRVGRAHAAARRWRATPVAERAYVVARVAELLRERADRYGALMTLEMGKLVGAAREEALKCATACDFYAQQGPRFLARKRVDVVGERSFVAYQPLGVILAVMPWNFPFWQVVRFAAPALVAGNVALLKHASNVPQCALALEELFRDAGAPAGVFQALLVGAEAVEGLLDDDRIAAATLTGSEGAGRAIGAAAGRNLKKTVLELGGSDPFVVMPSADLDVAVDTAVKARTLNAGQSCIAAKRFIVHEAVARPFEERFVARMAALRVGDPTDPATQVGPLASKRLAEELHAQVEASVAAGARLLTGGHARGDSGAFYAPTVLADAPPGSPARRDEMFGPVATLLRARDVSDAIALANDTPFGLGASVWTREPAEIERFVEGIDAGSVFVNAMVASDPRFPFGGVKRSGYGRELSDLGMHEFVNVKTVRISTAGTTATTDAE